MNSVCLFPWKGDRIVHTLVVLLPRLGFSVSSFGGVVEIAHASPSQMQDALYGSSNILLLQLLNSPEKSPILWSKNMTFGSRQNCKP